MKRGRPSIYSEELALEICRRIAEGESLLKICKDDKMPCRKVVHLWLLDGTKESFLHNYKTAVDVRTENMFDDLNEIADVKDEDESPNRSRLRIDTRKWYLSKVMPKKYGDKIDVTSDGKTINNLSNLPTDELRKQIAELESRGDKKGASKEKSS